MVRLLKKVKLKLEGFSISSPKIINSKLVVSYKNYKIRYEIINYLGKGTVGQVYMLEPINSLDKLKYVIKISNFDCEIDLQTEVESIEYCFEKYNIDHCSYPIYWGNFTNLNSVGVIYPYLGFYNLEKIKIINYKISWKNNISIIKQLIIQLIELKDIIHGDLKPSNIVINQNDDNLIASIIDFGLIKEKTSNKNIVSTNYITSPESLFSLDKHINCVRDEELDFSKHDYYGLYVIILNLFLNKGYWNIFSSYITLYLKINYKYLIKHEAIYLFIYIYYRFFYEDTYPSNSYECLINKICILYPKIRGIKYLNFNDFFMTYIKPNINYLIFESEYLDLFKDFLINICSFDYNKRLDLKELLEHPFLY
jgi:serine/threonine protein kinase